MYREDEGLVASFRADCLAWIALHHFLPAAYLRELVRSVVDQVSAGRLSLDLLFEEEFVEADHNLQSWVIRPRELRGDPLATFLAHVIRSLVWQNDEEAYAAPELPSSNPAVNPKTIDLALRLGQIDLPNAKVGLLEASFPDGATIQILYRAICLISETISSEDASSIAERVSPLLAPLDVMLRILALKHLGDLCADSDLWNWADQLYDLVLTSIDANRGSERAGLAEVIEAYAVQSKASSIYEISGPRAAALFLSGEMSRRRFKEDPLLALNASHDALIFDTLYLPPLEFPSDRRASLLLPPQLIKSHDGARAMGRWVEAKYDAASRSFWALLRRQLALGSKSETKVTKANYARNLLSELEAKKEGQRLPNQFWMAIRLLLESEQAEVVRKFGWSSALVALYVDRTLIKQAIAHCSRSPGATLQRNRVLLELFGAWTENLASEYADELTELLKSLALTAHDGQVSIYAPHNDAGRALELLCEIAEHRPELRSLASAEILKAVLRRLNTEEFWKGAADAIRLAQNYFSAFSVEQGGALISALLRLLSSIDPKQGAPVLVQPAMDLLISTECLNSRRRIQNWAEMSYLPSCGLGSGSNPNMAGCFSISKISTSGRSRIQVWRKI